MILNSLIDKYERSSLYKGTNMVNVTIAFQFTKSTLKDYFDDTNYKYQEEINEVCLKMQQQGIIKITWKKHQEGNVIDKVALNLEALEEVYKLLNRTKKQELESNVSEIIKEYCDYDNFLGNFAQDMLSNLSEKKSIKKYLNIEDLAEVRDILKAIYSMINQKEEIYRRAFSVYLFNDSKRFEAIESKVIRIISDYASLNSDIDILSEFNILKNPSYIYLKGSGSFNINDQILELGKLKGEIAFSSSIIDSLKVESLQVKRIVTIENLTTFHDYNNPEELIVYLGGYHNEVRRKFFKKLYNHNASMEFYHWGDIDVGGFRILNHLREKTSIAFKSMFMDVITLEKYKDHCKELKENDIASIKKMLVDERFQEFREVFEYMMDKGVKMEQEVL